jgi:cysteinyl-tRNA synthetase
MAMSILGETLDIHAGGVDLTFPHHEDEIAQSEAATGKPFSRFWCHGEFLLTDGAKMAKRVGNVSTVADLREQGVSAAALRHFVFSTHYRKQLNLSGAALEASIEAVRRVGDFADRLEREHAANDALAEAADTLLIEATNALCDDLNAPRAVGALFEFIHAGNKALDAGGTDPAALAKARDAFRQVNAVLDIVPEADTGDADLAKWVDEQLAERAAARSRRDFAAADGIRKALEEKGIAIEDSPSGTRWKKVR